MPDPLVQPIDRAAQAQQKTHSIPLSAWFAVI
jgi:hypothetical protein